MKRSEIAAARVQVALARRRGETPDARMVDLADTDMGSVVAVVECGYCSALVPKDRESWHDEWHKDLERASGR